jgi:hypothetical protein
MTPVFTLFAQHVASSGKVNFADIVNIIKVTFGNLLSNAGPFWFWKYLIPGKSLFPSVPRPVLGSLISQI